MGLVLVCCVYLLDGIKSFCFEVEAFPYFGEAASSQLLSSEISVNECLIFEDRFIMCTFENRFFIGVFNGKRFFISLSFVSDFSFVELAVGAISTNWLEDEVFVGMIAAAFVQAVTLEKFALALIVQFVLLEVRIIAWLTTFAPLVFPFLAGKL